MKKAKAEREAKDKDFRVYWKKGIRMDSKDKKYKIKIGGRIQTDWGAIGADDDLEASFAGLEGTGAEFRRARLYIAGTVYDFIDFKAQYDFGGSDADFKDVYIGLKKVPLVGHIKAGHSKEPFSLEELTSSKYVTFMERALPNAFSPGRNTGIKFHNAALNKRVTWGVGVFDDVGDTGDSDFDDFSDYNMTARVTCLPWYAGGASLLHVGLSYSHQFRSEDNTNVRYRARPEAHMTDVRLVDTGNIPTDGVDLFTPEVALVFGPLSLQGEYFLASLDSEAASDPSFSGYYAYASYFLTGEHRKYSTSSGAFSRVSPEKNFHPTKGGMGAWEVGLRYSHIDLNDEGISGG